MFQFKIMHRILATNVFFVNNKIKENSVCPNCNYKETIEHLLWNCKEVRSFWDKFQTFFNNKTDKAFILTCKDVVFGVLPQNSNELLNHLLLIAKYHVYSVRFFNKSPSFVVFLEKVKDVICTERNIAKKTCKTDRFLVKWNVLLSHFDFSH